MIRMNACNQRGFTLIEIGAVVVLAMLLIAAVGPSIADKFESNREKQILDEMATIVDGARDRKGAGAVYSLTSIATLTGEEYIFPAWGNGVGVNPKNGNYTARPNSADPRLLDVGATGLDNAAQCIRLERKLEVATNGGNSASCSGTTLTGVFK